MFGIVIDVWVDFEGVLGWEGGPVRAVAYVDRRALDEAGEVVLLVSGAGGGVERNAEEEWDERLTDGDDVFVLGLARAERGERFRRLSHGGGDFFGSHAWKRLGAR